jgi:hypothetical protein
MSSQRVFPISIGRLAKRGPAKSQVSAVLIAAETAAGANPPVVGVPV